MPEAVGRWWGRARHEGTRRRTLFAALRRRGTCRLGFAPPPRQDDLQESASAGFRAGASRLRRREKTDGGVVAEEAQLRQKPLLSAASAAPVTRPAPLWEDALAERHHPGAQGMASLRKLRGV